MKTLVSYIKFFIDAPDNSDGLRIFAQITFADNILASDIVLIQERKEKLASMYEVDIKYDFTEKEYKNLTSF